MSKGETLMTQSRKRSHFRRVCLLCAGMVCGACRMGVPDANRPVPAQKILNGAFAWTASPPLVEPLDRDGDHYFAVKDPSFVRVTNRWHLFTTVRGVKRSHQIEYFTFSDWNHVEKGERHILGLSEGYYCAPTVFYFTPQKKWYLLYQDSRGSRRDTPRSPAFSTNDDITAWQNWTKPQPLYAEPGETVKGWIDFWIICDAKKVYLFFTCDNGTMWRAETALADFPHGWSRPVLALQADIFEASHTYHVQGTGRYLTILEAIHDGLRYYKSYVSDALDGAWTPTAVTWESPFAGQTNVKQPSGHWTDAVSHGELFRAGNDERMEIGPDMPRMLFQGVREEDRRGKPYGEIPYRLGILSPIRK